MCKIKIIGISGSPHRNGNTAKLVKRVLEGCEEGGAEVEFLSLGNKKISFCKACYQCLKKGQCILADDLNEIREKMIRADGIVIGSPTYERDIAGQLKTFFDRLFYDIHRQTFLGKYAVCVITHEVTLGYAQKILRDLTMALGYYTVGIISAELWKFNSEIENDHRTMERAFDMGSELVRNIKTQKRFLAQDLIRKFYMYPIFRKIDKIMERKISPQTPR